MTVSLWHGSSLHVISPQTPHTPDSLYVVLVLVPVQTYSANEKTNGAAIARAASVGGWCLTPHVWHPSQCVQRCCSPCTSKHRFLWPGPACVSLQDAPAQTAKAIATSNYAESHDHDTKLGHIIAEGLAQGGAEADALSQALGQAYKQVRRRCSV
jgi:hypothetical protein